MSKKKENKPIPSYTFSDFLSIGDEKNLLILVEKEDDVYQQVKLEKEEFEKVCRIINKARVGFSLNVFNENFSVEEIDED